MKTSLRRWTVAAAMLSTSVALPAIAQQTQFAGDEYADYYGVPSSSDVDNEPPLEQVATASYIGDEIAPTGGAISVGDEMSLLPMQAHPSNAHDAYVSSPMADEYFSAPYGDTAAPLGRRVGTAIRSGNPDVWMTAELLLWFPQGRSTPPLGISAPNAANLVATDTASTVFDDRMGNGLTAGFRGDVGRYFADGAFGIGGRVWVLGEDTGSLNYSSPGDGNAFGIPFYNTAIAGEDAIQINNPGVRSGFVEASNSLSIVAAELYGRALVGESRNHRFELIGGYSHFNIQDDLFLKARSTLVNGTSEALFEDAFQTRNEFHGGQIGSEISLQRGRWTASSMTKVHLGTMAQRVFVSGQSGQDPVPAGFDDSNQGLFARDGVSGNRSQNLFTFAPEINLKLGYQFRKHVNFHVGYSFVYWSNVALAGEQMDRNLFIVDPLNSVTDSGRFVGIESDSYWVQGIDLGATIEF